MSSVFGNLLFNWTVLPGLTRFLFGTFRYWLLKRAKKKNMFLVWLIESFDCVRSGMKLSDSESQSGEYLLVRLTYDCCFHLSTRTLPLRWLIDSDMFRSTWCKLSGDSFRSHTTCDAGKWSYVYLCRASPTICMRIRKNTTKTNWVSLSKWDVINRVGNSLIFYLRIHGSAMEAQIWSVNWSEQRKVNFRHALTVCLHDLLPYAVSSPNDWYFMSPPL